MPRGAPLGAKGSGSQPISRVLSWATIHLGYASPRTSSSLPGSTCGPHARHEAACPPIWPCSRRGLPSRRVLPPTRCALTAPFHPYRHLLAKALRRFAFCCTFRGLTPPRRYLASCPAEPGLSSIAPHRLLRAGANDSDHPADLLRAVWEFGPVNSITQGSSAAEIRNDA